jgi:hypothetical protein
MAFAFALAGCGSDAPGATLAPGSLAAVTSRLTNAATPTFLHLAPGAPPIANPSVSFYAVKGLDREVFIWYQRKPGQPDSSKLVRFRVDKRSLCKRPNGSPIAPGDSIRISLTVTDPQTQRVDFQPTGLQFCPGRPAKLNMWYVEVDHDFDGDGDIDNADRLIESKLRIWKQEFPSSPWIRLTGVLSSGRDEVESDIAGFTSYLVAY